MKMTAFQHEMDRRAFLKLGAAAVVAAAFPGLVYGSTDGMLLIIFSFA